ITSRSPDMASHGRLVRRGLEPARLLPVGLLGSRRELSRGLALRASRPQPAVDPGLPRPDARRHPARPAGTALAETRRTGVPHRRGLLHLSVSVRENRKPVWSRHSPGPADGGRLRPDRAVVLVWPAEAPALGLPPDVGAARGG